MFTEMRRKDKALKNEDAVNMLKNGSYGTLAIDSTDGYPYAVPVNFAYADNKIYFHGAKAGLKYESLKASDKVSFCVVEKDDVIAREFTTLYRSAIAYGICKEVIEDSELAKAFSLIIEKYSRGFEKEGRDYIKKMSQQTAVFSINIEHLTAKGKG